MNSFRGELRYPTYSRVHRTIGSVRSRFKRKNFQLEEIIIKRIEPLLVIAQKAEIEVSNGLIIKLWKKLLECQPHDTLGGSISDNVAEDVDHRFKECFEIAEGIENYIKKRIAQRLELKENDILIFNTNTTKFKGMKEITFLTDSKEIKFSKKYNSRIMDETYVPVRKNIMRQTSKGFEYADEPGYYKIKALVDIELPSMGYKVISFEKSDDTRDNMLQFSTSSETYIKNECIQINYENGSFDIIAGNKKYTNIIRLYDSGNDGDTYDYSPLRGDKELELPWKGNIIKEKTDGIEKLILNGSIALPNDLIDRIAENKNIKKMPYKLIITLCRNINRIDYKLVFDNQVLSHRLRLKINIDFKNDEFITQIQGGFTKIKNKPIADDWEKEFVEKPVNIYNFDKAVGTEEGIFLFTKGIKECEKQNDGVYVTLMATTGQLGKPNLLWRPGRASGDTTSVGHTMTPTPCAQELGINEFEFAIKLYDEFDEGIVAEDIEEWLSPSISYQNQHFNLFVNRLDNKIWDIEFDSKKIQLSRETSFLNLRTSATISALYPSYTVKKAFIIRLANQTKNSIDITNLKDDGYVIVNALEERIKQDYVISPYDMITLLKKN